ACARGVVYVMNWRSHLVLLLGRRRACALTSAHVGTEPRLDSEGPVLRGNRREVSRPAGRGVQRANLLAGRADGRGGRARPYVLLDRKRRGRGNRGWQRGAKAWPG